MSESSILLEIAKIFTYTAGSYLLAMWWAPYLIQLLNWLKFWKKQGRTVSTSGEDLVVTKKFYEENEVQKKTPRAGGILIWVTTLSIALFFWFILKIEPDSKISQFLNFISRTQTFIPLGTLFYGSVVGLIDDALVTLESGGNYFAGGLKLTHRGILVSILSLLIGLWFHFRIDLHRFSIFNFKLDLTKLFEIQLIESGRVVFGIDFADGLFLNGGFLIIFLTLIILLAVWGSGIIDGFDGIAAGVFIPIFICFAALSFTREMYDISNLLMVMVGSMVAYLWFNLPPAKFYMGDTGAVGILLTLGVVAILIDYIYILPIAGIMLVLTEGSAIIQLFSKKFFKKKVFLAAPLHHHFEAMGFARNKITATYWAVSWVFSILGFLIGYYFR
jgi:phospho-N-acetylmuramoyl-pentapeptide-transferase